MFILSLFISLVGLKSDLERCKAEKKKAEADLTAQESSFKQQVRDTVCIASCLNI